MKPEVEHLIQHYLHLSGERTNLDFARFFRAILEVRINLPRPSAEREILDYLEIKALNGMELTALHGDIYVIVDEQSLDDILEAIDAKKLKPQKQGKKAKPKKGKKGNDLGKITDHGKTTPGNSDNYWGRQGIDLVFRPNDPNVRIAEKIPYTYKYADVRYLESYYGIKAFEFGNWLSQQDRQNYLSGLGLALFDLHKLLGFNPKDIGLKGKLSVAFGARGRGKALAHFEPEDFVINLTRYGRPQRLSSRSKNFRRVNLILQDGGVGSFAHEYGHALDFFAGTFIEKTDSWQISDGRSTNHALRFPSAKKPHLHSLMDTILNKILWSGKNTPSAYNKRLNKKGTKEYFLRRNEIWARSFEVYVHYKLEKKKYKNVFLNKSKYPERYYLTLTEMKKLEKDFDALLNEIKKHL